MNGRARHCCVCTGCRHKGRDRRHCYPHRPTPLPADLVLLPEREWAEMWAE